MRPVPAPALDASARRGGAPNPPTTPLSCFIATEADIDSAQTGPRAPSHAHKRSRSSSACPSDRSARPSDRFARRPRPCSPSLSSGTDIDLNHDAASLPPTPLLAAAFGPRSAPSGPSSPGNSSSMSLSEEPNSLSVSLAELTCGPLPSREPAASVAADSVPQLVMPSLTVPRRRPFSDVGRSLGKLKLLVAGQAGIGKTSLILSLAQSCSHIVYMDSVGPSAAGKVSEIHASTRPRPWWRADLGPAACPRRRRRLSTTTADEVLDRNLCFAECPPPRGCPVTSRHEMDYVESHLVRLCDKPVGDRDLCTLLSSGAEPIVDAVLYMLPYRGPGPADIDRIKGLQEMTNVIPLLARADELTSEEMALSKDRLVRSLNDQDAECFSFAGPESAREAPSVYAVSSATQPDRDTVDASVLMSSEYVEPLVSTDLEELVDRIFSQDGSSWLRHSAAVKSVNWRRRRLGDSTPQSALTYRGLASDGALVPYAAANPYAGRQCWGRIELSSWAEGLRQSLTAERLDRSRQVPDPDAEMPLARPRQHRGRARRPSMAEPASANHQDPLGLLELASQIKDGGRLTLELLSSLGVLGCLAAWLMRPDVAHQWDLSLPPSWCPATC